MNYFYCSKCGGSFGPENLWCPRCYAVTVKHTEAPPAYVADKERIAALEAELAAMTLERDGLALQVKMRPTLQVDMVPAEDLAAAQADHAYAIRMYDQKEAACIDALEKLAALEVERDALRADAERYHRMREATFSHVDGRDYLAELKPNGWHFCNIKVQVRINGEWKEYEGDWIKPLFHARDRDGGPYIDDLQKRVTARRTSGAAIDAARGGK